MKNPLSFLPLALLSLSCSSCCLFSGSKAEYRTETRQVRICGYDTITEQVMPSGKGGMIQTIEKKVPRYKTVTKKIRVSSACSGTRYYCPHKENVIEMATTQGSSGSPNLGLVPTMKSLAP